MDTGLLVVRTIETKDIEKEDANAKVFTVRMESETCKVTFAFKEKPKGIDINAGDSIELKIKNLQSRLGTE